MVIFSNRLKFVVDKLKPIKVGKYNMVCTLGNVCTGIKLI